MEYFVIGTNNFGIVFYPDYIYLAKTTQKEKDNWLKNLLLYNNTVEIIPIIYDRKYIEIEQNLRQVRIDYSRNPVMEYSGNRITLNGVKLNLKNNNLC